MGVGGRLTGTPEVKPYRRNVLQLEDARSTGGRTGDSPGSILEEGDLVQMLQYLTQIPK